MSGVRPSTILIAAFIVATAGPLGDAAAQATTGSMFGGGVVAPVAGTLAIGDTSTSGTSPMPSDITITGESDQASPSEAVTLDGQYIIAAGGSRQSAVLGAITFDPTGTVVTGTISIISAAAASTSSSAALAAEFDRRHRCRPGRARTERQRHSHRLHRDRRRLFLGNKRRR